MRKVSYKEWIESDEVLSPEKYGLFLGFFQEKVEADLITIALVEREDGAVARVLVENMKFMEGELHIERIFESATPYLRCWMQRLDLQYKKNKYIEPDYEQ